MIKVEPITVLTEENIENIYFDLSIIVDKENNAILVDNKQHDWKDFVDCNTLVVKDIKIDL